MDPYCILHPYYYLLQCSISAYIDRSKLFSFAKELDGCPNESEI
jgi:hypothetical protein